MQDNDQSMKEQENGWGGTSTADGTGTQMGVGTGTGTITLPQTPPVAAAPSPEQQAMMMQLAKYYRNIKNGGGWFYWIAGFSVINTLVAIFNGKLHFVIGLGATQVIDAIAQAFARRGVSGVIVLGLAINIVIAGVYVLCGALALRRNRAMFVTGMVLYLLDTLLLLVAQDWLSIAFHAYALYCIFVGFKADGLARQIETDLKKLQPIT